MRSIGIGNLETCDAFCIHRSFYGAIAASSSEAAGNLPRCRNRHGYVASTVLAIVKCSLIVALEHQRFTDDIQRYISLSIATAFREHALNDASGQRCERPRIRIGSLCVYNGDGTVTRVVNGSRQT